jgi:hypothetical protein
MRLASSAVNNVNGFLLLGMCSLRQGETYGTLAVLSPLRKRPGLKILYHNVIYFQVKTNNQRRET